MPCPQDIKKLNGKKEVVTHDVGGIVYGMHTEARETCHALSKKYLS